MSEVQWKNPVPGTKWVRTWRLGEWLSDPVSPLFETLLIPVLSMARERGGGEHLGWRLPQGSRLEAPWFWVINGYFFARADVSLPSFVRFLLLDVPRMEKSIARWRRIDLPKYMQRLDDARAFRPQEATPTQLLERVETLCQDAAAWWHLISLDAGGAGFTEQMFRSVYQRLAKGEAPAEHLLRGLDSPVLAGERRLYELIRQVHDDADVQRAFELARPEQVLDALKESDGGRVFLDKLDAYLGEYGHQVASLDLLFPTPQEDPALLVPILRKMMTGEMPDPAARFAEMVARREQAESELQQRLARSPVRRQIVTKMLQRCQALAQRREKTVFSFQWIWPLLRGTVLELGRRLVAEGVIDRVNQVFFVTRDELWDASRALENGRRDSVNRLAARAVERRERWEWQRTLSPPDRIPPTSDPVWKRHRGPAFWGESHYGQAKDGQELIGLAVSAGRAKGPARILHSPADFHRFCRGDVLVAKTTSPVWTPLFGLAAGVVTESGGVTSHASIVAREYGIPAVVATGCATRAIQDGHVIQVDGDAGVVHLLGLPAPDDDLTTAHLNRTQMHTD
jgi:pyruvate,water dikinase